MITAEHIKALRDKTGVSISECKKALEEAQGDEAKALEVLMARAAASVGKKADRVLGAGAVASYLHGTGQVGAMVLLSCETDFVSKNEEFVALARDVAMQVAATDPKYSTIDEVPEEARRAATEVFQKEVAGKPAEMQAKILEGKMTSYFQDQVLLDQPFIKDETKTMRTLLNEATQKFGERVEVSRFARLSAR